MNRGEKLNNLLLYKDKEQIATQLIEVEEEKEKLIKYLEDKIYGIQPKGTSINFFPEDGYDCEEDMIRANVEYNLLNACQDILERVKSGKYE